MHNARYIFLSGGVNVFRNKENELPVFLWYFNRYNYNWIHVISHMLAFTALSFMFIFTTNMVHFILSLMQQCKLPPKLAYGILAGYRFLPLMKEELWQIRAAHRVRGADHGSGIRNTIQQYKRYAIPYLPVRFRKQKRTAIAMESKGFSGEKNRTFTENLLLSG